MPVVVATGHDEVAVAGQKSEDAPFNTGTLSIQVVLVVVVVEVVAFVVVDDVVDEVPLPVEALVLYYLR